MCHRSVQVLIEFRITHQQAEGTFIAIQFGCHLLHIMQSPVYLLSGGSSIQIIQILRQVIGVCQQTVGILQHLGHLTIQTGRQAVQLV